MVRPVAGGWAGSVALGCLAALMRRGLAWWLAEYVSDMLLIMTVLATLVLLGWNILHPDREEQEERRELLEEAAALRSDYLVSRPERTMADVCSEMAAFRRAWAADTVSVNGLRYLGPPLVITPARGIQVPPDVMFKPCQAEHQSARGVDMATGEVLERVVKSECDGCGVPLDVAWCTPGVPYLCWSCRY
jgi:hypothetical protein